MFRRFFLNTILMLSLTGVIFLGAWFNFVLTPVVTEPTGIRYQLHPGTSLKTLSANLYDQGIVRHPVLFNFLARLRGSSHELKAGIYLIPQGTTPGRLLDQLTSGRGLLYHVFTIIPGWSFQQLRVAMENDTYLKPTTKNRSDAEVMKLLGAPQLSAEGEFFPDTYYFVEGTSDVQLLTRAFKRMQMKFQEAWLKRDFSVPFKVPYDALIAASLVEKESHLSSERPVIAGVLLNRLQKKMLLQFDPTVVYGLRQWQVSHPGSTLGFTGVIRKQDLQFNTPYNTYLHKGLPPTPIAMTSLDALNAVLHPVKHNYLYFVATGSGGHQFSATLEEHHLAVMVLRFHEQGFFNYLLIRSYLLKQLSFKNLQLVTMGGDEGQLNVLR
jgi:UPF0755 protein